MKVTLEIRAEVLASPARAQDVLDELNNKVLEIENRYDRDSQAASIVAKLADKPEKLAAVMALLDEV